MPTVEAQSQALLAVYANVSASYGLRLCLPIKLLRKALRTHLANYHLRTLELDDILRRAQETATGLHRVVLAVQRSSTWRTASLYGPQGIRAASLGVSVRWVHVGSTQTVDVACAVVIP